MVILPSKLLLKNWRDLKARKAQFGALIVLVALGISSYVGMVSSYHNLSVSHQYAVKKMKLADYSTQVVSAPKAAISKVKAIPGIEAVEGRLIRETIIELNKDDQATARVIGIPIDRPPVVNDLIIEEGSFFKGKSKDACLLEKHFAEYWNIGVGGQLTLIIDGNKHKVNTRGIISSPEYMMDVRAKGDIPAIGEFAVIFMPQTEVERLFKTRPYYNDFSILIKPGADRAKLIKNTESILDPYTVTETITQENQPSNFSVLEEIKQNQQISYMMPIIILIIAALSLFIALSRLVQSQRGEIGLAKALGYSNLQVLLHYFIFSVIIAVAGSVFGFALGELFAIGMTSIYVDMVGIPFLQNKIYLEEVINSVLLSFTSCALAGILPAYASARIPPATAMRADPNLVLAKGSIPILERIIVRFFNIPFTFRIPFRNVFRARRRSFYTIIGIAFALVLTIATWASFDSMDYLMDVQFNDVEQWDLLAVYSQSFSYGQINLAGSWNGVNRVQPALQVPVKLKANGVVYSTSITAMNPDAGFHGFSISSGNSAKQALESGGIIINPFVAKKLSVDIGDSIIVTTPLFKKREQTVRVYAISNEMIGTPTYIGIKQGRKLLRSGANIYNSLYLDIDPARSADIKKRLYDLPGCVLVVVKQSLYDKLNELMQLANSTYLILLAFAFTMAFAVVYNTFTTNILERLREIATMRTIGEDRWHLALIVTFENMLLALAGIPLGIWLGILTANAMFSSYSNESYTLQAIIYPRSYYWIVGSILIVLLISEIPAIIRVFRLDLAETTKILE